MQKIYFGFAILITIILISVNQSLISNLPFSSTEEMENACQEKKLQIDNNYQEIKKEQKETNKHPHALSPEGTLQVILQAYINRDSDTVMAYFPKGESKEWKSRLNKIKQAVEYRMTDEIHVKKIVEIKLDKIENRNGDKAAFLTATIETTPRFSSRTKREANGRFIASYPWFLRQKKGEGPWYHDGGGF